MKSLLAITLSLLLMVSVQNAEAQRRKVRRNNTKVVVIKNDRARRSTVRVRTAPRKRVVRTRAVSYHYRTLPRRGAIITTAPTQAVVVRHAGVSFRFHAGIWYKPLGARWIVTRPVRGIRVRTLPVSCRRIIVGQRTYHYYYGTYYVRDSSGYVVVDAPIGAEIDSLPDGYNTITAQGQEYYELDDVYYMPSVDEEGAEVLVAIENPAI